VAATPTTGKKPIASAVQIIAMNCMRFIPLVFGRCLRHGGYYRTERVKKQLKRLEYRQKGRIVIALFGLLTK
jgi:hypothetical protein